MKVTMTSRNFRIFKTLTKACPKGSILGPIIWNINLYYRLMRNFGDKVALVAYSDENVILVHRNNRAEIEKAGIKCWIFYINGVTRQTAYY